MKERRDYKKIFKERWHTEEEINNHYEYIKRKNDNNKERLTKIKEEYIEEIERAKKYFKKVNPSLIWDWLWVTNHFWRMFVYWEDLEDYIKNHSNI